MSQFAEQERDTAQAADPLVDHQESTATEAADQQAVSHLANAQIQMRFGGPETSSAEVRDAAAAGIKGTPSALPHGDRIQASFGRHDVGGVKAHVGEQSAAASEAMGANAFATGSHVGFAGQPDLHTAAHEAAHVVQQRGGVQLKDGVGEVGDRYEENADAVADQVVAGRSAAPLLDTVAAGGGGGVTGVVQRKDPPRIPSSRKRPSVGSLNLPKRPSGPKPKRPSMPKPKHPSGLKPKRPSGLKPKRPSGPKPKRPTRPKPRRLAKPKKIEPVIEEELLDEIEPDIEEEPLEEVEPDGTILTPHLIDGKWVMIEEEPLEELEPTAEDLKVSTVETEKKVVEGEVSNDEAKERIERGASAVGDLAGNVSKVEAPEVVAPKTNVPETTAPKSGGGIFGGLKSFFKGIGKIFSSKSESENSPDELPLPPEAVKPKSKKNPAQAASDLGKLKNKLEGWVPKINKATAPIAKSVLPVAKADCDETAQKIEPHVEPRWAFHLADIGVGIGLGFKAMAKQALMRGGIKYEDMNLHGKLGKGGSDATVYNASYLGMAPMAYKVRITRDYDDEDAEDQVTREGRIMRELSHPNILQSGGKTDRGTTGTGYAMERMDHGDLEGVIKKMHAEGSTLTGEQRLLIMRYLMRGGFRGLNEVHKKNLLHGDIKHQNFLLGDDLEPKLMDFGGAEEEKANAKDRTRLAGTGAFMAPEVVHVGAGKGVGGKILTPAIPGTGLEKKSDIWSMAETLLLGVFNRDSVDIQRGEKVKDKDKEFVRKRFGGNAWHTKLVRKVRTLENSDEFEKFIKKTMEWEPSDRMTAQQCLEHKFLKLNPGEEVKAKQMLRDLLKKKSV